MCLAIPGRIENIDNTFDETFRSAKVSFDGIIRDVNLMMVPDAKEGDYVMVHVGVALNIVDKDEAEQTIKYIKEIGEFDEFERQINGKLPDED
jgi:hydrogenase expression/formation protein HypC